MKLTSSLRKRLRSAISDAFPSYDDLRLVVGEGAWSNLNNVQLEKIAKPDPHEIVVYNLVRWAETKGRLRELVTICVDANPAHAALQSVAGEVQQLEETRVAVTDADDVAIDEQVYPAPKPLTPAERRLVFTNSILATALFCAFIAWTVVMIEGAAYFWLGTVALGLLTRVGELALDRPLLARATSTARGMLTHRAAFPILAVACGVFLAASLVIGRIQYFAVAATAPLIAGNTELEPGGIHWLPVLPLGRKVALAIMDMKLADAVLYPWHRNRVWAPPRIIIEPDFDVSQISTSESDPTLQWTMVVSVAPKEGKPWSERIFPYKGGPVIVWGAAPIVDGSPYPPTFQPKRPGQAVSIDDFAVLPGDVLEIEIRGPTKSFSTSHVVVSPENASSAVQVVYVPK